MALSLTYLYFLKGNLQDDFKGIKLVVKGDSQPSTTLVYTYSSKFENIAVLSPSNTSSDTLLFLFPNNGRIVKKFRIDFNDKNSMPPVKIEAMQLLFANNTITFDEDEVFGALYNVSASVDLDKKTRTIHFRKDISPFDPYIIFSSLSELTIEKSIYGLVLAIPFLIFLGLYFFMGLKRQVPHDVFLNILITLFILSIPLKIAWTTFCAILICAYGLYKMIKSKKIILNTPAFYFFFGTFLLYALLGRPSSFSSFDLYFSYLLFAFIVATVGLDRNRAIERYAVIFLVLNGTMFVAGLNFLICFHDFYGKEVNDYFYNIKTYSGDVMSWLEYHHAAFLSFFGLLGLLFAHELHKKKKMESSTIVLYHFLVLFFIIFSGTRICLLIYAVYLVNQIIGAKGNKVVLGNLALLFLIGSVLFFNIGKIDPARSSLWKLSWNAIAEKPFFGYGIGSSSSILSIEFYNEGIKSSMLTDLNHSHNQYLTILLEIGIVGFVVIGCGIGYLIYRFQLFRDTTIVMFLLGLGYIFLTESILLTSKPVYVLCFLFWILCNPQSINFLQKPD